MLLSLLLTLASGRASVRRHGRGKERGEPRVQGLDPPRGMVALLESKAEKTYRQESRDDPEEGNGEESKDAEKEAAETEGAEKEGAETEGAEKEGAETEGAETEGEEKQSTDEAQAEVQKKKAAEEKAKAAAEKKATADRDAKANELQKDLVDTESEALQNADRADNLTVSKHHLSPEEDESNTKREEAIAEGIKASEATKIEVEARAKALNNALKMDSDQLATTSLKAQVKEEIAELESRNRAPLIYRGPGERCRLVADRLVERNYEE